MATDFGQIETTRNIMTTFSRTPNQRRSRAGAKENMHLFRTDLGVCSQKAPISVRNKEYEIARRKGGRVKLNDNTWPPTAAKYFRSVSITLVHYIRVRYARERAITQYIARRCKQSRDFLL